MLVNNALVTTSVSFRALFGFDFIHHGTAVFICISCMPVRRGRLGEFGGWLWCGAFFAGKVGRRCSTVGGL